ncbi:MAG: DUF368 domain-containing protein, partial [Cyclobacteriaceae bacterium]
MQAPRDYLLIFLKGMAMGAADVVPGVSGGTIAFITGIYERLLNAIKSVDIEALKLLSKFQWLAFWRKIDATFLLPLVFGIGVSLVVLSNQVEYLLKEYPIQLWSFFFGLIVISAIWVAREVKHWRPATVLSSLIGIGIAYTITVLSSAQTPEHFWFIFLCGTIAICAMVLPGISGSFILILLGKYVYIITALNERNLLVLGIFALGCLVGLLSFARVVSWLLNKYHDLAIALLAGFMVGSLNKVWPWKETLETM